MITFLKRKKEKHAPSVEGSLRGDSASEEDEFHDTADLEKDMHGAMLPAVRKEALLHPEAHEEGGFGFTNKELLARQRGVITDIIKELGKKLLSGHLNLINVSMPVKLFEPRSYLEKMTDVWVYPSYLQLAAHSQDPVERMQHTITWFVAGLQHCFQSWQKPFNPILGETFQAKMSDGSKIFLEQISHHPPISAFQLEGPDALYVFSGLSQPDVNFELKANSVRTTAKGERGVRFQDGTEIKMTYPAYYMRGLLYTAMPRGDMVGTATFTDKSHQLIGEVVFGKVPGKEDEPLLQRSDALRAQICQLVLPEAARSASPEPTGATSSSSILKRPSLSGFTSILGRADNSNSTGSAPSKGKVIASGTGNWLSHLDWNGQRAWTLMNESAESWLPVEDPLPSDSRFRKDLLALKEGDLVKAQAAKEELEQRQREDAKLRKPGIESLSLNGNQRSVSLGH